MNDQTKILRQEMSATLQAGYKCATCNVITVVFAQEGSTITPPAACLNCGVLDPVLAWGPHLERRTSAIESV